MRGEQLGRRSSASLPSAKRVSADSDLSHNHEWHRCCEPVPSPQRAMQHAHVRKTALPMHLETQTYRASTTCASHLADPIPSWPAEHTHNNGCQHRILSNPLEARAADASCGPTQAVGAVCASNNERATAPSNGPRCTSACQTIGRFRETCIVMAWHACCPGWWLLQSRSRLGIALGRTKGARKRTTSAIQCNMHHCSDPRQ